MSGSSPLMVTLAMAHVPSGVAELDPNDVHRKTRGRLVKSRGTVWVTFVALASAPMSASWRRSPRLVPTSGWYTPTASKVLCASGLKFDVKVRVGFRRLAGIPTDGLNSSWGVSPGSGSVTVATAKHPPAGAAGVQLFVHAPRVISQL